MLKLGLTGNIGTGKSTVSAIFESLGVPVFYADAAAKEFYTQSEVIDKVVDLFGKSVLNSTGNINTSKLAGIVFENNNSLKLLTSIIHPLVKEKFIIWTQQKKAFQLIIMENAVLFEGGFQTMTDMVCLVTAPKNLCLQRVIERDGMRLVDILKRMNQQLPQIKKNKLADYIIVNDNKRAILPQVLKIYEKLISDKT